MKRTLTVTAIGIAALALLIGAAIQSRAIPLETHIARYTLSADVARLSDEYATLVNSLEAAWRANQPPGEAASALHQRIVASVAGLEISALAMPANGQQLERIENNIERLKGAIAHFDVLTSTIIEEHTEYANSLNTLRDQGSDVVGRLRSDDREDLAADLFELIAATIDFTAGTDAEAEYKVRRLLATLNLDQRIVPALPSQVTPLLTAATTIVDTRDTIRSRLTQLGSVALIDNVEALNLAAGAVYQDATSSAERARTMLTIYAVVLLLSVGLIGLRLHASYRALNRANAELGSLNESLEHRVDERTKDLSTALYELKESQVQLVQAEKMSSLGQLVAGISHEINTPLLYLANNATLIQERVEALRAFVHRSAATLAVSPADYDDRAAYQKHLIEGLRHLKKMLREAELEASAEEIADLNRDSIEGLEDLTEMAQSLKDFSRMDRAPVDSFDVNAGLDKTLNIARNSVKHKADVNKDYGDLPQIQCSPSKINQVFLNLITNAAQAIEGHGEISITTKLAGEDHVMISIADTGCGIPAENLSKIRDPFFTTKEVGSGTGLGLSIVDEIVRSHGGELMVESTVGEGSTFSVVLPIRQPGSASEPDARTLAEAV